MKHSFLLFMLTLILAISLLSLPPDHYTGGITENLRPNRMLVYGPDHRLRRTVEYVYDARGQLLTTYILDKV